MPLWHRERRSAVARDVRLIGTWDLDPADTAAIAKYGDTTMTFEPDGRLTYVVHGPDKDQVMFLTWRTEGDTIVTDQPSHPREDRTSCVFIDERTVLLRMAGLDSRYVRRVRPPA